MKKILMSVIPVVLGVAVPVAGVELFGYLVAHSLFSSSFEGNYPNLAVYSAMAIGWLPFAVFSSLILGLASPKPVWLFSGIAALITTLYYFVPSSPEGLSLPHVVVVLVLGWLVVPLSLGFSRLTLRSPFGKDRRVSWLQVGCMGIKMEQGSQKSTILILARAGLALSALMFAFGAAVVFVSAASVLVVFVLAVCAALLLWAAIFASNKAALLIGRFFPLG